MEQSYVARAAKYVTAQRKRQNWQKVVSGLCAVVVFCTVYALILPAITLTAPLTCGLEEHQHDESCYETSGSVQLVWQQVCSEESVYADVKEEERYAPFVLHVHDDLCYQDGRLICTFEEVPPHIHNEDCWIDVLDDLICGLEETPGGAGHVHVSDCYVEVLVCGQEESAPIGGHIHDESCYTTETIPGVLICENTEEDHQHDESCYSAATETSYLTCGQEESAPAEGHTHTSNCYEMQLVCGLEEGEAAPGHVHTEECYASKERVELCFDPKIAHEHIPLRFNEYGEPINADTACYDAYGVLTCTKWVTREHVHTEACFQEVEDPTVEPGQVLICEMTEHTHEESCYSQEEIEEPEEPEQRDDQWDAIFWSDVVSGSSDVVLDAWTNGSWMDTSAMDPELLAQLHAAGEADLTRALQSAAIQVGSQAYDSALHGPMDPGRDFSIMLTWSLNSNSFTGMTYSYQFPWQISVENVEKRVLNDSDGNQALTYSVWNNVLTVTYYAPAENVTTGFSLRASWSGDMGADTEIQWSHSDSTYVVFAEPELTVEKTMGEDGLRVAEDGTVWADYTVTVTNSGMVASGDITLTDVLEAQRFAFARGGYENGADYIVTVNGGDSYETFPDYDGGNTVTFPAFDLESGESRVFQYMAVMSAEDRAAVDAAVKASADPTQAGETVRNTATAVCHAFSGDLEFTSMSRATYGGPDSKHVENFTQVYETGAFNVSFTVNGDAQLPLGLTTEKLERTIGEGLQLTVETLDETAAEYQAFIQNVEEDAQLVDLQVLQLGLNYNGVKLDLADCDVTATVTPTEALLNYQKPHVVNYNLTDEEKEAAEAEKPLGDEGFGVVLKAFSPSAEAEGVIEPETGFAVDSPAVQSVAGMVEEGSIYIDRGDDPEVGQVAVEPITFSVENQMLVVQAETEDYPTYKVEFWANMDRLLFSETATKLPVIDTSGKNLPKNGTSPAVKYLVRDSADGSLKTTNEELLPLFAPTKLMFSPNRELTLRMFRVLDQMSPDENNYVVTGAEILDEKGDPVLDDDENPVVIAVSEKDLDTKLEDLELELQRDYTVKLIFKAEKSNTPHRNAVVFYDYDITDGWIYTGFNSATYAVSGKTAVSSQNTSQVWYANTNQQGINNSQNYANNNKTKFAFGNVNTGTGLGNELWSDSDGNQNALNKYNSIKRGASVDAFQGCTFGLVQNSLVNGTLAFESTIDAPNLFNQPGKAVVGKTTYADGYSLEFKRVGDTYTLSAVSGGTSNYAQDLDRLYRDYDKENGKTGFYIYSNNFWPMDNTDSHGTNNHDLKFGRASIKNYRMHSERDIPENSHPRFFPVADFDTSLDPNGQADHNCFFGMQFKVEFTIPKGYIGPLDYCFFGDDDLWLYLTDLSTGTSELICDIGGVHSSVGEYVNLTDYLSTGEETEMADGTRKPELKSGTYRLDLFYDERGASGSTCWMQYTLPGIQSVPVDPPPEPNKGNLRIQKKVEGLVDADAEFSFTLALAAGYDCTYFNADGFQLTPEEVADRELPTKTAGSIEFSLKANESLVVANVDSGKSYTITENDDTTGLNAYETKIETSEGGTVVDKTTGKSVTGSIKKNTSIHVTYTNTFYYALPETGGAGSSGTAWYTMGALPVMTAAVLVYKKKSRRKGGTHF